MTDCNNCKHETECNYNKRYDYKYDGIVDYQTDKEYNSFKEICGLLNTQEETIRKWKRKAKWYKEVLEEYGYKVIDRDDGDVE